MSEQGLTCALVIEAWVVLFSIIFLSQNGRQKNKERVIISGVFHGIKNKKSTEVSYLLETREGI